MGAESTSGSGESNETQVVLNVYNLTPINKYKYWFGFGIFHSGIEVLTWKLLAMKWVPGPPATRETNDGIFNWFLVHSKEYGFGAHDFPVIGLFEVEPRNCPGFLYRNSIQLDDDASESISNATPREFTEVYDTDQEKHLLSLLGGSGEVVFVKEVKSDS